MADQLTSNDLTMPPPALGTPTLAQRSAYAVKHLIAAARFSRQCGAVEVENSGKPLGPFFDEQVAFVSATIMLAVASMESNINEHLEDAHLLLPELSDSARSEVRKLLESASILKKYNHVLALKGLPEFDTAAPPYQDAALLIALRNHLVHFRPEWHDRQVEHEKLGRKLRGKFDYSPFMPEDTAVLFPQRFVGHGCTKWAVKAALEFMEGFAAKVGLQSRFANHKQHFVT